MKKLISLLLAMVLMLLAWGSFAPADAQDPAKEEKPTFYRLTPGVYVNGWPRFTVTYPKDWVERRAMPNEIFRAGNPGPVPYSTFIVGQPTLSPLPLDKWVDYNVEMFRRIATDVLVVSDKPSRLRDGSPAREVEIQAVVNDTPLNAMSLATKKGDLWITAAIESRKGKIGEDLKAILYSIEFQSDKDEPVKVPQDVQEFLDSWRNAIVSHDIAQVVTYFSDRFLDSGNRKGEVERFWRQIIVPITFCEISITEFIPAGNRAYLTGFICGYWGKAQLLGGPIIKDNGEWKWYGNQRDPTP